MTTNDDMIARLPKERQDKINKAVADEVKKYNTELKPYWEEHICNLDKQRCKQKVYSIIKKSKPCSVKKIFSKETYADVPTGTYVFYIDGYSLEVDWILDEIDLLFNFIDEIITKNYNIFWSVDYEGIYSHVVALPQENNMVRLTFLDRKEVQCRDYQNRYKDPKLNNSIVAKDIIINKYDLVKQFNQEIERIYIQNKYYISEEYKEKCKKEGSFLCQELVLKTFEKFIPKFKKYLKSHKHISPKLTH